MGPAADRVAGLWWTMLMTATVISIAVLAILGWALFRKRDGQPPMHQLVETSPREDRRAAWLILLTGGIIPAGIIVGVFVLAVVTIGAVHANRRADLTIEVVGRQWWWQVRYLDASPANVFTTANEIRIPVGQRVAVRLESPDVIHSFWVPALQGKRDLIPGRATVTWIEADRPGTFRGQCAEFCGIQHARMNLLVVAMPPDEYEAWAARERQPAPEPTSGTARRGRDVFLQAGCAVCHAIRGTGAAGTFGPDLTHLAARRTLASASFPNTRGHLGGWIANPQALKPGSLMPRVPLSPGDLRALLDYLQTLR